MFKRYQSVRMGFLIVLVATLTGAAIDGRPAGAGTGGVVGPASAVPANRLVPENVALAQQEGLWDVTETTWAAPAAVPVTTIGLVADRRVVGAALQETLRAKDGADRNAVQRIDYLTFNHVSGRWEYVSMDTRADVSLMPAWSFTRAGADGKIILEHEPFAVPGDGPHPAPLMLRMRSVISRQGPDHDMKEQYFVSTDGTGSVWLAHRYAYARRTE